MPPTGRGATTAARGSRSTRPPPHRRRAAGPRRSPRAWRSATRGAIVAGRPARSELAESVAALAAATRLAGAGRPPVGPALRPARPLARDRPLRRAAAQRRAGPRRTGPDSCCASATPPPRSRYAPGSPGRTSWWSTPHARWHEPTRVAETIVQAAPGPLCARWRTRSSRAPSPIQAWLARWRAADDLVPAATGGVAGAASSRAPGPPRSTPRRRGDVWVASSMPIRDVETFVPRAANSLRVPLEPGRERDRRHGVVSAGRRDRQRRARGPAHGRAGAPARPGRAAGGRAAQALGAAHDRVRQQRRRRDLRLPACGGRGEPGALRGAHRSPRRAPTSKQVAALAGMPHHARSDAARCRPARA